jgi:catechol 2,3-dioxygenase-like lactoylglutathione lyase family enzyme
VITIEKVDFLGAPVLENAAGDAWFGETLGLFERNPRSSERWVEYEAPNVTVALVPEAYKRGDHLPLPFGAFAIRVSDVDEEKTRLAAAGVAFEGETFDSGVCKGAMFRGIDGNGMLLHRRYAPFADGRAPDASPGRIDFVAIPVQDRAPVEDFYGHMLGLERNPNSTETWVEFETGNVTLALVHQEQAGQPFEPLPRGTIAFRVPDVHAGVAQLESMGVEFPGGVIDSGVCHIAPFSDPAGNGLMLHRRYAPFSDGSTP